MTFLSTGLLMGLVATAIPIALHLLARQQPRRIVFPTTRFLKASLDTHRDRLKVRRWWLLAIRILAIAALAIAFARPQIHTATSENWFYIAAIAFIGVVLLVLATLAVFRNHSHAMRYGLALAGIVFLAGSLVFGSVTMARAPTASISESSPVAIALILDNSVRSARLLNEDDSLFEGSDDGARPATLRDSNPVASSTSDLAASILHKMRAAAIQLVGEQTSDSLIAILDRSPRPATFSINQTAALARLERLEAVARHRSLANQVRDAILLVRTSDLERRSVILLTDLTEPSFDDAEWQAADIKSLLAQEPPVNLQILDCGSEVTSNYSLEQLAIGDTTPPRMAKTSVSVAVNGSKSRNTNSKPLSVQLDMYDTSSAASQGLPVVRNDAIVLPPLKSVDRTTIEATAGSVRAMLSIPPLEVGTHHGILRLLVDDQFASDNVQFITMVVQEPKQILVVGSDRDETRVLAGAINAPLDIDDPLAEYAIETSEFLPTDFTSWKKFAAVILLDPSTPTPPIRAEFDSYLENGGNLLTVLGPTFSIDTEGGTYPNGAVRPWRVPEPGTFLEVIRPLHPSVDSLNTVAGGVPWSSFRVSQYWQFAPSDTDLIIARFAGTKHPTIIERSNSTPDGTASSKRGVHLIVTTPMPALAKNTRSWNQLFAGADAWPAFLLVRDMVDSLVNRDKGSHNYVVGDSVRLVVPDSVSSDAPKANTSDAGSGITRIQMFTPTGPPVPLDREAGLVTIRDIDGPGTYWLRSVGRTAGFSVNLSPRAVDLTRVAPARLDEWLGPEQYALVESVADLRKVEGRGQPTRSLYAVTLIVMLAAFVLEQLLANRFYASRPNSAKQSSAKSSSEKWAVAR